MRTEAEQTASHDVGRRYRFERLALPLVLRDLYFRKDDPRPGERVPNFDLPVVGGGGFRSGDLAAKGPVLLVFGSSTCPMTDNAAPGLNRLHRQYGDRVRFVMVNVREAHPGKDMPQPATLESKVRHGERLRDLHAFEFEVAVDDADGTLHRSLGPKPNSAYLIGRDGTILFRAHWANDIPALEKALAAVASGDRPPAATSSGVAKAMARMLLDVAPALDRAGRGAWADMWRVALPLAALAFAMKRLGLRPSNAARPAGAGAALRARCTARSR